MFKRLLMFVLCVVASPAWAEAIKQGYVAPPVVTTESMVQMLGGLLLVLAMIGGLAWFLKRFSLLSNTSTGVVKVIAATGVGQRERVVVVEIDNTWLVLGVAPGRVNKLHALEKPRSEDTGIAQDEQSVKSFAAQLNNSIER
ncbi:MAG: flagellar biosynthetic protein FliO [Nitrosomonas sp.]|nr:MAG: flagellar biosynthetic protein FliO [Nitrosomonas sp.]